MLELTVVSSLSKPPFTAAKTDGLWLLRGERAGLQLCLLSDKDAAVKVFVESPLPCTLYTVEEVYSGLPVAEDRVNCTVLGGGKPGVYPDLLRPTDGGISLEAERQKTLWIEFSADEPGEHRVRFSTITEEETESADALVRVSATPLPAQSLIVTDWFHADCLAAVYNVDVWSEAHWAIVGKFMKNAVLHGVNCIYTPLFTPALDTAVGHERPTTQLLDVFYENGEYTFDFSRLSRWIALAEDAGIRYFEFSHFFTQWGAKRCPKVIVTENGKAEKRFGWEEDALSPAYVRLLTSLGAGLTAFTNERGLTRRCFVHVSDEPGEDDLLQYERCAALIHSAFGAFTHLDALSDLPFYEKGLVQVPVPSEGAFPKFAAAGVKNAWTYYCCGQFNNEEPNRFFCMPSARNRVLGALLWKFGCRGFLHWGFNFYFTQYSLRVVDPFAETDAGGAFPSGDSFIVYPGKNGEPLPSLREKVFFDAVQDYAALTAYEEKYGRKAAEELLEAALGDVDFHRYPMEEKPYEDLRKALWRGLEK